MNYAEALLHAKMLNASIRNTRWNGAGQRVEFVEARNLAFAFNNNAHKAGAFVLFGVSGEMSVWTPSVFDLISEYEIVPDCGVAYDPLLLNEAAPDSFFKNFYSVLLGNGVKITREQWNGKNMHLTIKHFCIAGADQSSKALVCLKTPTGEYFPYVPPITDIVSGGWSVLTN